MKTKILLFGLCFIMGQAFGCDDSDSGPDFGAICSEGCAYQQECNILDGTYEECLDGCEAYAQDHIPEFTECYLSCVMNTSCEILENHDDNCFSDSFDHCNTDPYPIVRNLCEIKLECNGDALTEDNITNCINNKEAETDLFPCFKQSTLNSLVSCFENSACEEDFSSTCYSEVIGWDD
ncbi:hypothetical protein KKF34_13720 [Myxococcota bacterium]|nr:hypothetical protein [Myxococcota bacterium]MBU1379372.1 hypothetical protein [Myxococcota bacterium]MBU1497929.1 hypothetical protein [Myxococcota bacterium]